MAMPIDESLGDFVNIPVLPPPGETEGRDAERPRILVLGWPKYAAEAIAALRSDAELVRLETADHATTANRIAQAVEHWGGFDACIWFLPNGAFSPFGPSLFKPLCEPGLSRRCRFFSGGGAGYDDVDVDWMDSVGAWYCNTPTAVTESTATATVMLILACLRDFDSNARFVRCGEWARSEGKSEEDNPHRRVTHSLDMNLLCSPSVADDPVAQDPTTALGLSTRPTSRVLHLTSDVLAGAAASASSPSSVVVENGITARPTWASSRSFAASSSSDDSPSQLESSLLSSLSRDDTLDTSAPTDGPSDSEDGSGPCTPDHRNTRDLPSPEFVSSPFRDAVDQLPTSDAAVGHHQHVKLPNDGEAKLPYLPVPTLSVQENDCDNSLEPRFYEGMPVVPEPTLGVDPEGLTLGIIGMGAIGRRVARRMAAFGMNVVYHNRRRVENDENLATYLPTLEELLKMSDVVSLHCPLTSSTKGLLGPREFGMMKKGAFLINTSRGAVIDEAALVNSLRTGSVCRAALDVFPHEPFVNPALTKHPNVLVQPHAAAYTSGTFRRAEEEVIGNASEWLKGSMRIRPTKAVNKKGL